MRETMIHGLLLHITLSAHHCFKCPYMESSRDERERGARVCYCHQYTHHERWDWNPLGITLPQKRVLF